MGLLRKVPAAVKGVTLEPGDRRVAWALSADGEPVVATERGLLLPGLPRIDWPSVERAAWARPLLSVRLSCDVEGAGPLHAVALSEDEGDLPEVVRARVTASVAWSRHERLGTGGGVRVVGRRSPGRDQLDWQLVWDRESDRDDPRCQTAAAQLLDGARATIG